MELPESLALRLRAWRDRAHAWQGADELFRIDSWTHVLLGQGIVPHQHHPVTRGMADADMRKLFGSIRQPIDRAIAQMPSQQEFIERYSKAAPEVWAAKAAMAALIKP
jgi:tryptophan halogenase